MNTQEKKDKIKSLVVDMLNESHEAMIKKIDKALNSGAIDVDKWDPADKPMIIPKCIVIAVLEDESMQFTGKGTSYERYIKKEVKNIRYFI